MRTTFIHSGMALLVALTFVISSEGHAKKRKRHYAPDTLGTCSFVCELPGRTFLPQPVNCLPDMTFEHCMRIGRDQDIKRWCESTSVHKVAVTFSTKSCDELERARDAKN